MKYLALFATALCALGAFPAEPGHGTLIAHRGESVDAPENTLPAFKTAVERGFGFECDVYLSKDGRVFTFHDRNLTRTTAGANTNKCADVLAVCIAAAFAAAHVASSASTAWNSTRTAR